MTTPQGGAARHGQAMPGLGAARRGSASLGQTIKQGELVLASKYKDGDPKDEWCIGYYDRFDRGRHMVVDVTGNQVRLNGFRRAGRITPKMAAWLIEHADVLETAPGITLWGMLTDRSKL